MNENKGSVLALDLLGGTQKKGNWEAQTHDDNEDNVRAGADGALAGRLCIEAQVDGTSDDGTGSFGSLPNC